MTMFEPPLGRRRFRLDTLEHVRKLADIAVNAVRTYDFVGQHRWIEMPKFQKGVEKNAQFGGSIVPTKNPPGTAERSNRRRNGGCSVCQVALCQ